MPSATDLYESAPFRDAISQCRVFRLKHPRGGQYNDGYELLGTIQCDDSKTLLSYLSALGIKIKWHQESPDFWCPPPLIIEGKPFWIEYDHYFVIRGLTAYVTIDTTDHNLTFNLNSTSWFDVTLDDVKNAIKFEQLLEELNIINGE
ncbi:hypothetical protein BFW38_10095 [Terasakiispira papahanaumokuakeensis]|uniref:Uncharacterized protein n=1 Tax=Terasakiispira papahanaumokuakeensis TaxID=197479 RepID=A0A1E2VAF1_9GAMM|nr:hypothetical protein [Terasakiispira papahanaumokuakeensis]ODC03842.1 hypothetical protein BFW38_10095 [Terasakiispira papahanaumokuakeensis]